MQRVRLTANQMRIGVAAGASALAAAGATVAWAGARGPESPVRERLALAGYAPGLVGAGVAALAAPLLMVPRLRGGVGAAVGVGIAAAAGLVVGTGVAHLLGAQPARTVFEDRDLPAPNAAQARAEADSVLAALDRTKQDLVLWLPGTYMPGAPKAFRDALTERLGSNVSLASFPTHNDYYVQRGAVDSAAALDLVVGDLARTRRPGQRILLAGDSQGAWSIGEAMQHPQVAAAVDRAVLTGNPGVSAHQYDDASDPKVRELFNEGDTVAADYRGDASLMVNAAERFLQGEPAQVLRMVPAVVNNPAAAVRAVSSAVSIRFFDGYEHDPHNYDPRAGEAVGWLAGAPRPSA